MEAADPFAIPALVEQKRLAEGRFIGTAEAMLDDPQNIIDPHYRAALKQLLQEINQLGDDILDHARTHVLPA